MTAFETAWGLLKMPIVPDSLKYLGRDELKEGRYDDHWEGEFEDPITNVIRPLKIRYKYKNLPLLDNYGEKDMDAPYHTYAGHIGNLDRGKQDLPTRLQSPDWRGIEKPITNFDAENIDSMAYVNWVDVPGGPTDHHFPKSSWSETKVDLRKRGYMKALYDSIAFLMSKQGHALKPSDIQSSLAEQMWDDKKEWPVRDDL